MRQFLCCVEAIVVDHVAGGFGNRVEILEMLHTEIPGDEMTEETWGASNAAQASQRAMIGLVE